MTTPRRSLVRSLLVALALAFVWVPSAEAKITVKMATLAPEGTVWYRVVRQIADDWARISGGEVEMKIFAGGVAGNETAIVRKMRIGQLHMGAVTNIGVADIESSAQVIQSPMLINSYPELDYVMGKMSAEFERRIREKGFVVLTWGDAGWVHIFSKQTLTSPGNAGDVKLMTPEGDPKAVDIVKAVGFNPVVLSATDALPALQSGLINGFASTPLAALSQQWFALAPNMLDVPWAPLMGATVITKDAWDAIPEQFHEAFMKSARDAAAGASADIRRQDKKAVEVMKKYKLKVNAGAAQGTDTWEARGPKAWEVVRGGLVDAEIFDAVQKHLTDFRSKN